MPSRPSRNTAACAARVRMHRVSGACTSWTTHTCNDREDRERQHRRVEVLQHVRGHSPTDVIGTSSAYPATATTTRSARERRANHPSAQRKPSCCANSHTGPRLRSPTSATPVANRSASTATARSRSAPSVHQGEPLVQTHHERHAALGDAVRGEEPERRADAERDLVEELRWRAECRRDPRARRRARRTGAPPAEQAHEPGGDEVAGTRRPERPCSASRSRSRTRRPRRRAA